MKHSFKVGLSFGFTSAIITTLGLMIGLFSTTASKTIVLAGIITIAVSDALSDSLGIHISQESIKKNTTKQVWQSTLATFTSKLLFALTFAIPILIFNLNTATIINIIWGLSLLAILSYKIGKGKAVLEHVTLAIVVIAISFFLGKLLKKV